MTISVGRLAPVGQWDQTMLDDLLANRLYPTGLEFERHEGYPPRVSGACIILPGRYWHGHEAEISRALSRFSWVLLFVTSDEESLFGTVDHPNIKTWRQTPRQGREYPGERLFPVGYTPHVRCLPAEPPEKTLNVFLSCQDTHQRRHECFAALDGLPASKPGRVHRTPGFTQGMDPAEYMRCMSIAKIAPCPSGAVSVDSFRAWEALESGAIPVVDAASPVDGRTDYWTRLLGEVPFPVVEDWSQVSWTALLENWNPEPVAEWYRGYKRRLALQLREDLEKLGAA